MIKKESLTGLTIGNWTIGEEIHKNRKTYYKCICRCGKQKEVYKFSLLNGDSKSCGCLSAEKTRERSSKDKTGMKIGNLTLIKRLPNYKNNKTYYYCKCDCGNVKNISDSNLVTGKGLSCGCVKKHIDRKSYVGQRFGRLLVVEMLYNYNSYNSTYAKCQCECGNIKDIFIGNLRRGNTRSCGCLEKESRYNRNHIIDITGERFGLLQVIGLSHINNTGHATWQCRCDCGRLIDVTTGNLNRGHVKSCGCNKYEFYSLDLTDKVFGKLTALYPVTGSSTKARKWRCVCECGNYSYVSTNDLTSGSRISCGCIKMSKSEFFIADILTDSNMKYIQQYKFEDCKNIKPLPFDFYLPEYNIAIEYQGQQHYKSVALFGGDKAFEQRKINDRIKSEYCLKNNITLLCLPYTLTNNEIKYIIQSIKNPVTTTA